MPGVSSCGSCGSLASLCPERACQAWNRSFVRWCRRCGRDLRSSSEIWDQLRTSLDSGGPTAIGKAEVVADLSDLDGPTKSRSNRVAVSAVQGFLALHQAGGFVALVRPFSRSEQGRAFDLREPEGPTTSVPAHDPTILPGGRFLLLADRREVSVIDLWDTEISVQATTGLARKRLRPDGPIACGPIPLGESRIGLILGSSAPFSWQVWDLNESEASPAAARSSIRMPKISGEFCEASLVAGKTLTFATPEGHWAWRLQDAEDGEVDAIRKTWPGSDDGESAQVEIAGQVKNPRAFVNPSQVFRATTPEAPFYWHFRTTDGRARSYRVKPSDLSTDDCSGHDGMSPVGLAVRLDQNRPSMIFDKSDMLYEEGDIAGQLAPCQVSLPGEGRAGLQLVGTLIVTIGNARGSLGSRPIEIQSLWGGRPPIRTEDITGLASDPFLWSGHMFTVERPDRHRLILVRRALKAPIEESQ
jgi:hypothetical protein